MADQFNNDPNESEMAGSDAAAKLESSQSHFKQAAEDLKAAAAAKANEYRGKADEFRSVAGAKAEEVRGMAEDAWAGARQKATGYQQEGEQYVRENPTRAVLSALGIGFVLGLIFRK